MIIKRALKIISLKILFFKDRILGSNKSFKTDHINSLVLFIGPYRNLTTYFASILSLHPNCEVLNHAGMRIFKYKKINFLAHYSTEKYNNFLRFFNYAIKSGYKGNRGGNISYSHAFETNEELNLLYLKKRANEIKNCMVWKESQLVTNHLMNNPLDLEKILTENPKIKFLFPIRHTLDCATSNIKTNKYFLLGTNTKPDLKLVTKAIFNQYTFFLSIQTKFPDRFYFLFENKINKAEIDRLCVFFNINNDDAWCETILKNYKLKPSYEYSKEIKDWCLNKIKTDFSTYPEFESNLTALINKSI